MIAEVVKKIYNKKNGSITDSLATKILLGTLACISAYDVYFTKIINKYKYCAGTQYKIYRNIGESL